MASKLIILGTNDLPSGIQLARQPLQMETIVVDSEGPIICCEDGQMIALNDKGKPRSLAAV